VQAVLDYYDLADLFNPEEIRAQKQTREFVETEIAPYVDYWWEEEKTPADLMLRLGELGLLEPHLPPEYGSDSSSVAAGLIVYELERADSGLRSLVSTVALVGGVIYYYGSEEQKKEYLPAIVKGEIVPCWALTEPQGGSDPGAMETMALRDGEYYVLSGHKKWAGNGNIADIAVVWAKDEEEAVRGFIVPIGTPGFEAKEIKRKMSMRTLVSSELTLKDVRVNESQMLPKAEGLLAPLNCLTQARYGIVWGAMGALEAVYSEALEFARTRTTFGGPIGSRQLVQAKLAEMVSEHTVGLLLAWRLARMRDEGTLKYAQVSLAKRNNVRAALESARVARDILAGNGITLEYNTIRHMLNLEAESTLEGTNDVHSLVLGRDVTGFDAFGRS
jgi:glutaryl-CoA dehydrogenase